MFLTDTELRDLTGYKRAADIRRWLDRYGFSYLIAANGMPRVMRSAFDVKLSGTHRYEPKLNLA